ncbi:MAG: glycosyltransferase family 4 protein [Planctomycetales bacterium]|nr:glycosyltransferase family 4 protein [Planctomycetales bacterium]
MIDTTDHNTIVKVHGESEPLAARVAILVPFVAPHKKPIYQALANRCESLAVLVSTPMEENRYWQPDWDGLDVIVQRTWTIRQIFRHRVGFREPLFVHVPVDTWKRLRQVRPDVIISHEFGFRTLFAALYRQVSRKSRLVIWGGLSEHTEKGKGLTRLLLRKLLIRLADVVVVNGKSGMRYVRNLGMPDDRVLRFPYATIPSPFDDAPPKRDESTRDHLVFVGSLIERKGIVPFVECLADWCQSHPDREIRLTLVGEGPERPKLESLAKPDNLRLEICGHCGYERIHQAYREASIFAFPSLMDDWGMAVNEAMQAGLPILGSPYSQAIDEMVVEGEHGWRFHTDRRDEMYSAIDRALGTPWHEQQAMGERARRRIEHRTPDYAASFLVRAAKRARQEADAEPPRNEGSSVPNAHMPGAKRVSPRMS